MTGQYPEIASCPFCGGDVDLHIGGMGTASIRCGVNGCRSRIHRVAVKFFNKEYAIAAWNKRAGAAMQGGMR